jgi:hypothetical protein
MLQSALPIPTIPFPSNPTRHLALGGGWQQGLLWKEAIWRSAIVGERASWIQEENMSQNLMTLTVQLALEEGCDWEY